MRVLVTRPEPDNLRTANALRARGHDPILARLTAIAPVDQPMIQGHFDAVVATSAHALECLTPEWCRRLQDAIPLYVVGERTAEAARKTGFHRVIAGPGDAAGLVDRLLAALTPRSHVLYLAGEPRKPTLEMHLEQANHAVQTLLVYRALPALEPPAELFSALNGEPLAVLHFSRASAASFATLAEQAGKTMEARHALHVCLSADVAAGLYGILPRDIHIAAQPQEAALLETLGVAIAQNMPWPAFKDDGSVPPRYSAGTGEAGGTSMSETADKDQGSKRASRRKPQTIDLSPADLQETTAVEQSPVEMPVEADKAAMEAGHTADQHATLAAAQEPEASTAKDGRQAMPTPARRQSNFLPGALAGGLVAAVLMGLSSVFPALFGNGLPARVAELEARPASLPAPPVDLKPILDRVAQVEQQLPALSASITEALADIGTAKSTGADIAALRARLDEVASGATTGAAVDPATLASLAQRLTALEAGPLAGTMDAIAALEARLKTAETAISAIRALADAPRTAVNPAVEIAARLAVFDALKRKLAAGQNFSAELAAIAPFAPESPAIAPLKLAEAGTPTLASLADGFLTLAPAINTALQPQATEQSLLQRLAQSASGLVEVTPIDGATSAAPSSLAERVAADIRAGDLGAALDALASLPDAGRIVAKPVIDNLVSRQSLEKALADLGSAVAGQQN